MQIEQQNLVDSIYNSVQIQTLSGTGILPKLPLTRLMISLQSIIAYILTTGLIISGVNPIYTKQLGMDLLLK